MSETRTYVTLSGEVRVVPVVQPRRRTPGPKRDADGLSRDQRRTKANNDMLSVGVHPATRQPLLGGESKCGDCAHHHALEHHSKVFHKCDVHRLGMSHSAESDVRVSWPACTKFEAADV